MTGLVRKYNNFSLLDITMWLILVIVLVFLYLIKDAIIDLLGFNPVEVEDTEVIDSNFVPASLQKYNGTDSKKIFIAVKGNVYDVTQGASFYGPNGPYGNFAGRDASRGLALNSFDPAVLTPINEPIDDLEGLTTSELESLTGWEELFESKYPIVGKLSNPKN